MAKASKPKKRKIAPDEFVVVGTYKEKQLAWIKKNGVYNYPVREGDDFNDAALRAVKELWLYADVKSTQHAFAVTGYLGKMSKAEFIAKYPTYAKLGKQKSNAYYVFKVTKLDYKPTVNTEIFIARTADFDGQSLRSQIVTSKWRRCG